MMLQDKLMQDARQFLKEEIDPRRNEENARMFKSSHAEVTQSTTVIAPQPVAPATARNEETLFSPNSNAQGV